MLYRLREDLNCHNIHLGFLGVDVESTSLGNALSIKVENESMTIKVVFLGGKFDVGDRLFFSIPNSWNSCTTSTGDCKELIPEFFYLPEFLTNTNRVELGRFQATKEPIGDVVLPPWASTPEEFIRLHREALESDYVSDHLHEWIDLIFGYKQQGQEAIDSWNVYHPLTYEGYVDLQQIKDPIERRQIIAQIENYGQTPTQLLTKPHPKRMKIEEAFSPFLHNPSLLSEHFVQQISNVPIVAIRVFEQGRVMSICKNGLTTMNKFTLMNYTADTFYSKYLNCLPFSGDVQITQNCFAISKLETIYSAAHWDNSFKITTNKNVVVGIFRHQDVVSCLALDEDYLVTGSIDTTLIV